MKIEFDRPDYCEGCPNAEYRLTEGALYGDGKVVERQYTLICTLDEVCRWVIEKRSVEQRLPRRSWK